MNLPLKSYRLRVETRFSNPGWIGVVSSILGIVLALIVGGFVLRAAGAHDPIATYREIFKEGFGTLGDWQAGIKALLTNTDCPKGMLCFGPISDTLVKASPILLTGLACIIAFRMKLWNIGADGQMFMGAWAATGVAIFLLPKTTDRSVMLAAMALAGMIGGFVFGAIPGFLKAWLNINEIIITLMLNYVAYKWMEYFIVVGPWSLGDFRIYRSFSCICHLAAVNRVFQECPHPCGSNCPSRNLFRDWRCDPIGVDHFPESLGL